MTIPHLVDRCRLLGVANYLQKSRTTPKTLFFRIQAIIAEGGRNRDSSGHRAPGRPESWCCTRLMAAVKLGDYDYVRLERAPEEAA